MLDRWSRANVILLWLQRAYLQREFGDAFDREARDEDRPIDLDHIQPQADWRVHANNTSIFDAAVADDDRRAFMAHRGELGNMIGNLRWVSSSVNRRDGDRRVVDKLALDGCAPVAPPPPSLQDCRIEDTSAPLWADASAPALDRIWTPQRLKSWQQVVEERTMQLYRMFWDEAGFDQSWVVT